MNKIVEHAKNSANRLLFLINNRVGANFTLDTDLTVEDMHSSTKAEVLALVEGMVEQSIERGLCDDRLVGGMLSDWHAKKKGYLTSSYYGGDGVVVWEDVWVISKAVSCKLYPKSNRYLLVRPLESFGVGVLYKDYVLNSDDLADVAKAVDLPKTLAIYGVPEGLGMLYTVSPIVQEISTSVYYRKGGKIVAEYLYVMADIAYSTNDYDAKIVEILNRKGEGLF